MNGKNIRFQHLKINKEKNSKFEIEGEIIDTVQQSKDFSMKSVDSEPMKFCPECNGMMIPTENGILRCNSCGYGTDGSKRRISKPYYYYNHEPEIKNGSLYTDDQKRIIKRLNAFDDQTFDYFCSYLNIPNTLNKDEIIENLFSERSERFINDAITQALDRKFEITKENNLKNRLANLEEDVFNILVDNLNVSTGKNKEQQIEDIISGRQIYQVENEIEKARKPKSIKKAYDKRNNAEKRREAFKEELLKLDSSVLEQLFIEYDLTSSSMSENKKLDILARNYTFKDVRKEYKRIKRDMELND